MNDYLFTNLDSKDQSRHIHGNTKNCQITPSALFYDKRIIKSVRKREEWEKKIEEEYINLGINDKAKQYISSVFIDCKLRANR